MFCQTSLYFHIWLENKKFEESQFGLTRMEENAEFLVQEGGIPIRDSVNSKTKVNKGIFQ
jgi:hypothetical protein